MGNIKAKAPRGPQPLTEEEKRQQIDRFLSQQRIALTQGAVFNILGNPGATGLTPEEVATRAVATADAVMEKLFINKEN